MPLTSSGGCRCPLLYGRNGAAAQTGTFGIALPAAAVPAGGEKRKAVSGSGSGQAFSARGAERRGLKGSGAHHPQAQLLRTGFSFLPQGSEGGSPAPLPPGASLWRVSCGCAWGGFALPGQPGSEAALSLNLPGASVRGWEAISLPCGWRPLLRCSGRLAGLPAPGTSLPKPFPGRCDARAACGQ